MIWLTWRQHRGQIVTIAIGLLVLGALLFVTGRQMRSDFVDSGLDACLERLGSAELVPIDGDANCVELGEAFAARSFNLRLLALVGLLVLPVIAGSFLGAPVVARELEQGTHQLVWTQGVSRRRWSVVKFAALGLVIIGAGAALSVAVDVWFEPLDRATGERFTWLIFDQHGPVLGAYALFAFATAVLLGAMSRRTLRAISLTFLLFVIVRFGVAVYVRPSIEPLAERTYPVVAESMPNPLAGDWIVGGGGPGVGGIYDANGEKVQGGQSFCTPDDAERCDAEYGEGAYNYETYHPASRFWRFQWIETIAFGIVSILLLAVAQWWVRRRLT